MDLTRVRWRKSRHSGSNGDCVEVGTWRKASHSGNSGECVEVGPGQSGVLAVRDSKDPSGPVLVVAPSAWQVFTNRVKTGAFPSS
jgi:uncharacterized protein DUF397